MKCSNLVLIAALLVGCSDRKPAFSDAEMQEIATQNPGMKEACLNEMRWGGVAAWRPGDPECFEMEKSRRWKGIWNSGWEWTNFCPSPARDCPIAAEHGDIWLKFAEGAYKGPELSDGLYEVEFDGSRSKVPGAFGHLSQYDHLMIVDQMISIRKIPEKD